MTGIPLTVVAGYLGSGKTTAITELLASDAAQDVAVIVNDFGELEFDAALLSAGNDLVSFSNGCVCCSITDGLGSALAAMAERRPRRVVLEASGVAEVNSLANWSTTPGFFPGGVVVCADATTIASRLRDRWVGETVSRQLSAADVVLLTHADLASDALVEGMRFLIAQHAPGVPVVVRRPGAGLGAALAAIDQTSGFSPQAQRRASAQGHAHHESWTLLADQALVRRDLERALRSLPSDIMRVKGFVHFAGEPGVHTVQRAGKRVVIAPAPDRATQVESGLGPLPLSPQGAALTVIGREGAALPVALFAEVGLTLGSARPRTVAS